MENRKDLTKDRKVAGIYIRVSTEDQARGAPCRISRWNKKYIDVHNCINDGSRSTAIAMQVEVANHSKVLYSKDMVLSVREKATVKLSGVC